MKTTTKKLCALALALLIFSAATVMAQSKDTSSSGSMEDFKQALGTLGQDLKHTASEAGDVVSQWWNQSSTSLGEKATAATIQTKVGVVLETNKDNLTIVLVGTDGKNTTFTVTEETQIMIQDAITGLQTPFTDGKNAKFKNIKKGDWVNVSYTLKDFVQARLPNATNTTIPLKNVDILR
ncbi:MAG: hypothetical protein U0I22_04440 [Treponema sp.]|nr:hypothetical protein [Treponema sp.]